MRPDVGKRGERVSGSGACYRGGVGEIGDGNGGTPARIFASLGAFRRGILGAKEGGGRGLYIESDGA